MLKMNRTYVAAQWPADPKPQGRVLEGMHRKIVAKMGEEAKEAKNGNGASAEKTPIRA